MAETQTILVVDDEPIVTEVVARYLRRDGFHVVSARDGDAALAAALDKSRPPALVVLDVMLPGVDGLEVCRRVQAQLRRVRLDTAPRREDGTLHGGDVDLDVRNRICRVRGEPVTLTPKEFDLLHHLMAHPGDVFSRDALLDAVWDQQFFGFESTVTVHIRRLREKIEPDPDRPTHVKTVWGVCYKFDPSVGG
jgi:DNA-binding response OmpR family regulator